MSYWLFLINYSRNVLFSSLQSVAPRKPADLPQGEFLMTLQSPQGTDNATVTEKQAGEERRGETAVECSAPINKPTQSSNFAVCAIVNCGNPYSVTCSPSKHTHTHTHARFPFNTFIP